MKGYKQMNAKMKTLQKEKGFTIIEVVLVLAIAGLIFLMVFIALPALQRSQADTQRRQDAGRFLSQVTNYQTDNRGNVPPANATGFNSVVTLLKANNGQFSDPDGNAYTYTNKAPNAQDQIQYVTNATCNPAGSGITTGAGARKVAVVIALSSVQTTPAYAGTYCTSN